MEIIIKKRQSGKTIDLIKKCHNTKLQIVCMNNKDSERIYNYAVKNGYNIKKPITYDCFYNGRFRGKDINGFLIDNVDILFHYLSSGVPVVGITLTGGSDVLL